MIISAMSSSILQLDTNSAMDVSAFSYIVALVSITVYNSLFQDYIYTNCNLFQIDCLEL